MTTRKFYLSTVAGIASLLAANAASAGSVTYTIGNPVNHQTDIINQALTVQLFNPTFGTLTGIVFALTSTLTSNFVITAGTASITNAFGNILFSDSLAAPTLGNVFSKSNQALNSQTFASLAANQVVTALQVSANLSSIDTLFANTTNNTAVDNTALFGQFTGTGISNLLYNTTTTTGSFSTGGNASTVQSTVVTLGGTVTYNYFVPTIPVPEPFSAAVLAAGLAGLAAVRKRRA